MEKKKTVIKTTAWVSLGITFVMMCILHMWWTMFVLFAAALVIVAVSGKNRYCSDFCPLGALQDSMADEDRKPSAVPAASAWFKFIVIPFFWGATILTTFTYRANASLLWVWILRIMISMTFLALVTQMLYKKRYFCVYLCPLRHPVLEPARKLRKTITDRS
ncbi:4Fe-4S binding protein [Myxococcota bacterium]|nr:4Fe-4S binding protein [Myxococcota bacterium]MBU1381966.1 4Fe-4S binding protein [Myxococcota bacterium]MBU1498868.1 4Fe-4S binding protein [Myxococcota bacterium]